MTARLAVVDDEPVFTEFIETLLRSRGYSVDTFNHGTALIDRLRAGYQPNLVLLDVMMPDIDGLETLRTIRQANPNVQVIMLSGRQAPATIVMRSSWALLTTCSSPGTPTELARPPSRRRSGTPSNASR
jgi:CheY-like chemotaxis protein